MALANISEENNRLVVSGVLNFITVVTLWQQSLPLLAAQRELQIDLSNVTAANSGGLALLLEWLKYAKKMQKSISFIQMPKQLQSMAQIAGIDKII